MKLWQKIYFITLFLVIITLNGVGFLFIQNFHDNLLQKEIDKCIMEQKFIASQLNLTTSQLSKSSKEFSLERFIYTFMEEYTQLTTFYGNYKILDSKNNLVYTDLGFPTPSIQPELQGLALGRSNYIIRPVNGEYFLYLSRLTMSNLTPLKIYYAKNISYLYVERQKNFLFFLKLDILICLIFAIAMLFISKLITKPIDKLIRCTKEIASGEYANQVNIQSKDEFGTLATHFNFMAETIQNKMKELELSNEEKEIFIRNFTHELKTPMTSIIGYANFIRTSKYDEKNFFEASDYIYKEGKRLEQMTFKMMNLIYAKSPHLECSDVNIVDLLKDVKKSLLIKLNEKQIELIIKATDQIIFVDTDLMKVLLCNLVENSIKASPLYSSILIKVNIINEKITIFVIDKGIGIAPEHLSKIGQPFYIIDPARTRKNNGAGLGLSICKQIAKVHQASFNIESQLDKGTTVSLIFSLSSSNNILEI